MKKLTLLAAAALMTATFTTEGKSGCDSWFSGDKCNDMKWYDPNRYACKALLGGIRGFCNGVAKGYGTQAGAVLAGEEYAKALKANADACAGSKTKEDCIKALEGDMSRLQTNLKSFPDTNFSTDLTAEDSDITKQVDDNFGKK